MKIKKTYAGSTAVVAVSILAAVLGSLHAFSVFLAPLEARFDASRSAVALTYSFALVALTAAVLIGPRFFGRWPAGIFVLSCCGLASFGAVLAGMANSLPVVWIGYSLIFGSANGFGYGFGLQIAAQYNPGREGLAMGIVTAAYAFGAVLSPALFNAAIKSNGFSGAMLALASALLIAGVISAALLQMGNARFRTKETGNAEVSAPLRAQKLLWLGYFGGGLAGLMVIGHSAEIAASIDPGIEAWVAPTIVAACNLLGSLAAGRLTDVMPPGVLLAGLPSLTSLALVGGATSGHAYVVILSLGLVGFAYGGTIAAYPAVIAKLFGVMDSPRVYGRVFTAWGSAGLLGPWLAGRLFEWSNDYFLALLIAASVGVISLVPVYFLFRSGQPRFD